VTVECCRLNLNAIVKKYRDTKGLVDYEKVGKDEDFIHFEEMVCEFQKTNLKLMGTDERLKFCINLYNLLVIHAFAKVNPLRVKGKVKEQGNNYQLIYSISLIDL
jgi:hypothetical protein